MSVECCTLVGQFVGDLPKNPIFPVSLDQWSKVLAVHSQTIASHTIWRDVLICHVEIIRPGNASVGHLWTNRVDGGTGSVASEACTRLCSVYRVVWSPAIVGYGFP
jgi:hypothetical protein